MRYEVFRGYGRYGLFRGYGRYGLFRGDMVGMGCSRDNVR